MAARHLELVGAPRLGRPFGQFAQHDRGVSADRPMPTSFAAVNAAVTLSNV